jgi:hypothetical protein
MRKPILPILALLPVLAGCSFPGTSPATTGAAPSGSPSPSPTGLPEERILILEPGPGSRQVGSIHIAGLADPTFEQHLGVRIVLDDGTLLASTSTTIQAEWGSRGPFSLDVPFSLPGERNAFIQVFDTSARDGGLIHLSSVGVVLADSGPAVIHPVRPHPEDIRITSPAPGSAVRGGTIGVAGVAVASFEQTLVVSVLDESGATIALQPVTVEAPDYGIPGIFRVDLRYAVPREQPGRIVVADPSVVFSGENHLASVEVILAP